jgi:hypothetical protein
MPKRLELRALRGRFLAAAAAGLQLAGKSSTGARLDIEDDLQSPPNRVQARLWKPKKFSFRTLIGNFDSRPNLSTVPWPHSRLVLIIAGTTAVVRSLVEYGEQYLSYEAPSIEIFAIRVFFNLLTNSLITISYMKLLSFLQKWHREYYRFIDLGDEMSSFSRLNLKQSIKASCSSNTHSPAEVFFFTSPQG